MINISPIKKEDKVKVTSGNNKFIGEVQNVSPDFDQWVYMVNGEWYCQSEVELLTNKKESQNE